MKKIVYLIMFLAVVTTTYAGVAVSPLDQKIKVLPGKRSIFYIDCVNIIRGKWTKETPIHLSVTDFIIKRDGDFTFPKGGTAKYSACRWIRIEESDFTLKPGESKKVKCEILLPRGAQGEYIGVIMVDIGLPVRRKNTTVAVQHRTASVIYATAVGRIFPKRVEVSELKVLFHSSEPVMKVIASLKNKGRVSFSAQGEVKIMDKEGRTILEKFFLEPSHARIFPGGIRDFTGNLRRPLPAGEYLVKADFTYGDRWRKARKKSIFSVSPTFAQAFAKSKGKDSLVLLDINPKPLKMNLYPGSFRTALLKVFNPQGKLARVEINVKDQEKWITIYPSSFSLEPYQEKRIRVSFKIPSNLKEGEYSVKPIFEVAASPIKKMEFPILVRVLSR